MDLANKLLRSSGALRDGILQSQASVTKYVNFDELSAELKISNAHVTGLDSVKKSTVRWQEELTKDMEKRFTEEFDDGSEACSEERESFINDVKVVKAD